MEKKQKPTLAETLRDRTDRAQFNRIVKGMGKEADNGKSRYVVILLKGNTLKYLLDAGFTVSEEFTGSLVKFIITW